MTEVFWLIAERLAGRAGPTVAPWSLRELRGAGFDAVLNLSQHAPQAADLSAAGLLSCWVPLPAVVPADAAAERVCLESIPAAQRFVSERLAARERTLVHYNAGCDRTGMLLAYHLATTEGLDARHAIDRVRAVRPAALSAEGWEAMALRVIARLRERALAAQ